MGKIVISDEDGGMVASTIGFGTAATMTDLASLMLSLERWTTVFSGVVKEAVLIDFKDDGGTGRGNLRADVTITVPLIPTIGWKITSESIFRLSDDGLIIEGTTLPGGDWEDTRYCIKIAKPYKDKHNTWVEISMHSPARMLPISRSMLHPLLRFARTFLKARMNTLVGI